MAEATIKIRRFNPERDAAPHWETYTVPAAHGDRVLDALHYVKWHIDGSLTFRPSCARGVCGSDAMQINDVNRLAARRSSETCGSRSAWPLRALPLKKDLLVDLEPFLAAYRSVMPYLIPGGARPSAASGSRAPTSVPGSRTRPSASSAPPAPPPVPWCASQRLRGTKPSASYALSRVSEATARAFSPPISRSRASSA